jgi:gamma-glutamylcyclotransferase (GGCT)/AIG2-like uncharacterized protein YtfP
MQKNIMEKNMKENYYVLVYGSLKKGFYNHRWMVEAKGQFIDEGVTIDSKYDMVGVGDAYPGVVAGNRDIAGEVYLVSKQELLEVLDYLEGYPQHYDRGLVNVKLKKSGEVIQAIIYYLTKESIERIRAFSNKKVVVNNNVCEWSM